MTPKTKEEILAEQKYSKYDDMYGAKREGYIEGLKDAGVGGWIDVRYRLPNCHFMDGKYKRVNWVLGVEGRSRYVCVYTKGHELEYGDEDPSDEEADEIEEKHGCLYLKPGWYELEETPRGEYDETWVRRNPTHWQPLPNTPEAK